MHIRAELPFEDATTISPIIIAFVWPTQKKKTRKKSPHELNLFRFACVSIVPCLLLLASCFCQTGKKKRNRIELLESSEDGRSKLFENAKVAKNQFTVIWNSCCLHFYFFSYWLPFFTWSVNAFIIFLNNRTIASCANGNGCSKLSGRQSKIKVNAKCESVTFSRDRERERKCHTHTHTHIQPSNEVNRKSQLCILSFILAVVFQFSFVL